MELKIHSVGFKLDNKLEDHLTEKISKITKYNDQVVSSDIYLKLENTGQVKDKVVEVKVLIPGHTVFIENQGKTFETAFDKALVSVKRQLKKHKELIKSK